MRLASEDDVFAIVADRLNAMMTGTVNTLNSSFRWAVYNTDTPYGSQEDKWI